MLSTEGPALATGDVNRDGLDDFYVGGAKDQPGVLYLQNRDGSFRIGSSSPWLQDRAYEDVDATFFDANGDGWLDLYVVSGGNEFPSGDLRNQDRLYLNQQGNGFAAALASGLVSYIQKYGFDGVDFDIEHRTGDYVACAHTVTDVIRALRSKVPSLKITMAPQMTNLYPDYASVSAGFNELAPLVNMSSFDWLQPQMYNTVRLTASP